MQRALPGAVNLPLTQEGPGRNPGHVATRMRRGFRLERKRLMLREVADLIMAVDRGAGACGWTSLGWGEWPRRRPSSGVEA